MGIISKVAAYVAARVKRAELRTATEAALASLHTASAEKERELARESRSNVFATYVETVQKFLRNASIAYGFIVTFAYFFFAAHVFPSGLTLGDSVLFIFVAVGFGFASVALAFSGLIFWAPVYAGRPFGSPNESEDTPKEESQRMFFSLLAGAVAIGVPLIVRTLSASWGWAADHLVLLGIAWICAFAVGSLFACGWRPRKKWNADGWAIVIVHTLIVGALFPLFILGWGESSAFLAVCFATAGALLSMSVSSVASVLRSNAALEKPASAHGDDQAGSVKQKEVQRHRRRQARFAVAFAVVAFLCPLTLDHWFLRGRLSAKVLDSLGLRFEDVTVRFTGSALDTVRTLRTTSDAALSFCEQSDGSALVYPITLLWYGPGTRSLVAFGPAANQFDPKLSNAAPRFEVAASEVQPAQSGNRHCHDIEHSVFFATKMADAESPFDTGRVLDDVGRAARVLYPIAASSSAGDRWRLARVVVTGYADDMSLPKNGNEMLAHRRASCVAARIVKYLKDSKLSADSEKIVYWQGEGARAPARACVAQSDRAQQIECNTANRRTRVRMIFECLGGQAARPPICSLGADMDPPEPAGQLASAPSLALAPSDNVAAKECLSK